MAPVAGAADRIANARHLRGRAALGIERGEWAFAACFLHGAEGVLQGAFYRR